MLGQHASDERLHMKIRDKRRELKSLKEVYDETWKQEIRKECNSIKDQTILKMQA